MIIVNNSKERVEVTYRVDPIDNEDGKLKEVEVERYVVRYPVSPSGKIGWSRSERTTEPLGTVRAEEIPALVQALTQALVYTEGVEQRWIEEVKARKNS